MCTNLHINFEIGKYESNVKRHEEIKSQANTSLCVCVCVVSIKVLFFLSNCKLCILMCRKMVNANKKLFRRYSNLFSFHTQTEWNDKFKQKHSTKEHQWETEW